jgi:hypothetical protein
LRKYEKSSKKKFEKKFKKGRGGEGGEGGWIIVIPMPEAINFVDGHRQKIIMKSADLFSIQCRFEAGYSARFSRHEH